MKGQEAKG